MHRLEEGTGPCKGALPGEAGAKASRRGQHTAGPRRHNIQLVHIDNIELVHHQFLNTQLVDKIQDRAGRQDARWSGETIDRRCGKRVGKRVGKRGGK